MDYLKELNNDQLNYLKYDYEMKEMDLTRKKSALSPDQKDELKKVNNELEVCKNAKTLIKEYSKYLPSLEQARLSGTRIKSFETSLGKFQKRAAEKYIKQHQTNLDIVPSSDVIKDKLEAHQRRLEGINTLDVKFYQKNIGWEKEDYPTENIKTDTPYILMTRMTESLKVLLINPDGTFDTDHEDRSQAVKESVNLYKNAFDGSEDGPEPLDQKDVVIKRLSEKEKYFMKFMSHTSDLCISLMKLMHVQVSPDGKRIEKIDALSSPHAFYLNYEKFAVFATIGANLSSAQQYMSHMIEDFPVQTSQMKKNFAKFKYDSAIIEIICAQFTRAAQPFGLDQFLNNKASKTNIKAQFTLLDMQLEESAQNYKGFDRYKYDYNNL